MASLLPSGKQQFTDSAGAPLMGGKLYSYDAGTTTPRPTYFDAAGTVLNTNPVVLDARGEATVFWSGAYKVVLRDADDAVVWTVDGVTSADTLPASLDAQLRADLASSSNPAKGPGLAGFAPQLNYAAGTLGRNVADREWNPRDFPWLAKFDGIADDTAAITACLNALYAAGGGTMLMPRGTAMVTSIALNWAAPVTVNIKGAGKKATKLKKVGGTTTPVLNFSSDAGILETYCTLADFGVEGDDYGGHGIYAQRFARFDLERVDIRKCDAAIAGYGLLVGAIKACTIQDNKYGLALDRDDTGTIYSNAISVEHTQICYSSIYGVLLTRGSGLYLYNCDLEKNGTAGQPPGLTSSGAVLIRSTCGDEYGMSVVAIEQCWMEANKGTGVTVEDGAPVRLSLESTQIVAQEATQLALNVRGGYFLAKNSISPSPGDQWTINASASTLINCQVATINDTSSRKTHLNCGGTLGVDANGGFSQDLLISQTKALRFAANNLPSSMAVAPDFGSGVLTLTAPNGVAVGSGAWGQPLRLGAFCLWVDAAGKLRIKNGSPGADGDGAVVGTQS